MQPGVRMSNIAVQRDYTDEIKAAAKRKGTSKIMKGVGASPGVAVGPCRVILRSGDLKAVKKGEVLVFHAASPDVIPFLRDLKGLVTEVGGQLTSLAHHARVNRIPHVAAVTDVMGMITDGQIVQIDGLKGTISFL
jgi:pyruvate, water dikinase